MPRALSGAGLPLRPEDVPDWVFHIGYRPGWTTEPPTTTAQPVSGAFRAERARSRTATAKTSGQAAVRPGTGVRPARHRPRWPS
jgi:hypothetical protein